MNEQLRKINDTHRTYISRCISGIVGLVIKNPLKIELLTIIGIFFYLCTFIPYINLLINIYVIIFFLTVASVMLFSIHEKRLLQFIGVLFLISLLLTAVFQEKAAEQIGNLIYFLLWFVAILYGIRMTRQ